MESEEKARAHEIYKRLIDRKIISGEFEATYYGYFESREAFAHKKQHTIDSSEVPEDYCREEYTNKLFTKKYVFIKGHVFKK
jgi:hypothetical protein